MKYIYDIVLNFNKILYDFYEWNRTDNFVNIKKIPIIRINNKDFINILNNNIKLNNKLFETIKNKTELYENKKDNCLLIINNCNIIGLKFNEKGITTHISSLNVIDELDIIELNIKKEITFKYQILDKRKNVLATRLECQNKEKIKCEINSLNLNKDKEKIKYIYFEYFGKKEANCSKALKKLKSKIKYENFNTDLKKLFNLITNKS